MEDANDLWALDPPMTEEVADLLEAWCDAQQTRKDAENWEAECKLAYLKAKEAGKR